MSRNRILVYTTSLLLSCSFVVAEWTPTKEVIEKHLKPWCEWKTEQVKKHVHYMKSKNNANYMEADDLDSVTVGSIQSKFADEYGAYNFSVEFTSATNTGFDDKSVDKSRTTRAKVMLGLIGLADLVYKGEKSKGRQAELGYQIRDAIEMFNNRSVVKEKLTPEEKEYLDGLHKTIKEIVVDPNSESEEE